MLTDGMLLDLIEAEETEPRFLAWSLALGGAIQRRVPEERQCPHASPDAERPLTALLTSRLLFCDQCAKRFAAMHKLEDDGRCDVCDREATEFAEFQGRVGLVRVHGNMCPSCRSWLESVERAKRG
jgi:hypothetical protein